MPRIFLFILLQSIILNAFSQNKQFDAVSIANKGDVIEIKNGLLGLVIPSEAMFKPNEPTPAPIQAFIFKDQSYSDNTKNILKVPTNVLSMKVTYLIRKSSQVKVMIVYTFLKPEFTYGGAKYKGGEPGAGYYSCILDIKQGAKSIVIDEDSNFDISYSVDVSNGLTPDRARYRGWESSSKEFGYEPSGVAYRSEDQRGYPLDATVDIDYNKPLLYGWLKLWEPAGGEQNTGRYWQLYNSKGDESSNLLGFFQGSTSKLIGGRAIGIQLLTTPADINKHLPQSASLKIGMDRRGPDNSWYPRKRYQWGVFISTKQDLLSPEKTQPIAKEMNKTSGLGGVINRYVQTPIKIVRSFYDGAIYTDKSNIKKIISQLKTDEFLYKNLCEIDGVNKRIWDTWRYPDSAISTKNFLINLYDGLPNMYINEEGTYTSAYRYWKGSLQFKSYAYWVLALFADDKIKLSQNERDKLEKLVGAMARILWDDNNAPIFDSSGINYGPANMYYMYSNSRSFFALLLANDPEFSNRAKNVTQKLRKEINAVIYSNGASIGTPHYSQPAIEPILFSMLQLRHSGITDLFKENERIKKFARFYLTLLTPPSVRFMGNRKLISFGDGSEESAAAFGLLAEGLKNVDPELSKELAYAFLYGPPRETIFGSVGLVLNLVSTGNEIRPHIKTANYKGYLTHFRSGQNTNYETALWALNGDSLFDHRNDDAGEIALYALGAPVSLSRSSFYYPQATDGKIRSVVIPANQFSEWADSAQPISGRSLTNRTWPKSDGIEFAQLGRCNAAVIKMSGNDNNIWYRKIIELVIDDKLPIFAFYDSIAGGSEKNIWSMMLMSEGSIKTPLGEITPNRRLSDYKKDIVLPKGTKAIALKSGVNRFAFTGQKWIEHPTKGINFELYTKSNTSQEVSFAQWGTTWQNNIEKQEFMKTNKIEYTEEQQIIRIKGGKVFFNLLLPFNKGVSPYNNAIGSESAQTMYLKQNDNTVYINKDYFFVKKNNWVYAALLSSSSSLKNQDISITGGYTEIEYNDKNVVVRISGNAGVRKIFLPFEIKIDKTEANKDILDYSKSNGIQIKYKINDTNLEDGSIGFKEYTFVRK